MTSCRNTPPIAERDHAGWAHSRRKVYRDRLCFTCYRAKVNATRRAARAGRVLKTYGLTQADHEALFRLQGGRCPHGRPVTLRSPIDHDHSSGDVRGILCDPCNRFLGYIGDRPQALLNLWAYLVRPPAQVPRVTDHAFLPWGTLVECVWRLGVNDFCGRLRHEHE